MYIYINGLVVVCMRITNVMDTEKHQSINRLINQSSHQAIIMEIAGASLYICIYSYTRFIKIVSSEWRVSKRCLSFPLFVARILSLFPSLQSRSVATFKREFAFFLLNQKVVIVVVEWLSLSYKAGPLSLSFLLFLVTYFASSSIQCNPECYTVIESVILCTLLQIIFLIYVLFSQNQM